MSTFVRTIFVFVLSVLCVGLVMGTFAFTTFAEPSYTMNYQGKLADNTGATVTNGTYQIVFKLYTAPTGGAAIWTETRSAGNKVTVTNGLFSVMLGSLTSLSSVNFNQPLYLGVTVESDSEMTPRKIIGTVPSAFEAKRLGGVASSSFLRNDVANSASSLLTFNGGLLSNASSTIARLSFLNATGTSLYLGGDRITDFTGSNLTVTAGALGLSSSYAGQTSITTLGTISAGTWQGAAIASTYLDSAVILSTEIDTSSELAAILGDETGTGFAVFSASPTFTGAATFNGATFTTATTTNLVVNGERFTDLTGTGIVFSANTLTASLGTDITASEMANSDHGFFSYSSNVATLDSGGLTSANLTTALTDETGSGAAVFGTNPTFTGNTVTYTTLTASRALFLGSGSQATTTALSASLLNSLTDETGTGFAVFSASPTFTGAATFNGATFTTATTTNLVVNGERFTDLTGTGLVFSGNSLTATLGTSITAGEIADGDHGAFTYTTGSAVLDSNVVTPNNVKSTGQTDEYCLTYEATGTTWEWQSCAAGGGGSFTTLTDVSIASLTGYRIPFTNAAGTAIVDDSGFLFNGTTDVLTVGTATFKSGGFTFTGAATTTLANNNPYAFTFATSSTARPLFRIDTTTGGETVQIGAVGGDVYIGGVGSASNLIFEESSTISGQGGNRISLGVAGDKINFGTGINVGFGTTTPNQAIGIFRSAADSAIEFSSASGSTYKWSMGIDYSDAGKFKISSSSALGTNDRFSIDGNGKVKINGDGSNNTMLDVTGNTRTTTLLVDNTADIRGGVGSYTASGSGSNPGYSLILQNDTAANGAYNGMTMDARNSSNIYQHGYIGVTSVSGAAQYTPHMVFGLQTAANTYQEYLRLTSAGNFGIGTTSPAYKLAVAGDVNATGKYRVNAAQVIYYPDQATLTGSVMYGNGGASLSHSSGNDGYYNTGVGLGALQAVTSGSSNVAVGNDTLKILTIGYNNVAVGSYALTAAAVGSNNNIAIGTYALGSNAAGTGNVAIGGYALTSVNTGTSNTALGNGALQYISGSSNNLGLGIDAGSYLANGVTTNTASANSVFVGYGTRSSAASQSNEIVIGYSAVGNGSNSVTLGSSTVTKTILRGNVGIASTTPWQELSVVGDFALTGRIYDSLASAGTSGMILQTTGSATRWVATSSLNLGASAHAADSLDFSEFQDTLDLDANTNINADNDVSQFGLTMTSDLSVAARSAALLTLTQASNVTNDFDGTGTGMLNITNSDAGSDTALLYLNQGGASGRAINISAAADTTASIVFVGATSISSGRAIDLSTGSTIAGSLTAFTGDYISVGPSRIHTGATTVSDTGNFLDLNRLNVVNNAGGTYNITGDLATLSSSLTETAGTITDSSNILSLAQNCGTNADCTGTVLELTNAGTGNGADFFMTNTASTQTNGMYIRRNGSGGTTSNGLNIASDAGTLTTALLIADGAGTIGTGIQLSGTFSTNLLDTPSLDISASGVITGATGVQSSGSSTLARASFTTATTTNLVVNGERFNDLTGTGLAFSANTLTATLGTDITAAEIANGDHGFFSYSSGVATLDTGGLTSANLFGALTNETGSAAGTPLAVFSESPTIVTPTFTTSATVPLIYGGTGAGSSLSLQSTSGNGTSDFIRFLVGNAGATEAGRFTTAGRLGLGTTTPNQKLSIFANGADAAVEFSTISGGNEKWTVGIDDSDGAKFKISSSSALGTNDRFVIDGSGRIGVGTASPNAKIDVYSGGTYGTRISEGYTDYIVPGDPAWVARVGVSGYGSNDFFSIVTNTSKTAFTANNGGELVSLWTAGQRRFSVDNSGNVGIGTTTPNQALTLFRSAADSAIEFSSLTGSSYKWAMGIDYSDGAKFKISSSSALGTNDRFVINGAGNVGINNSSPLAKLDVVSDTLTRKALLVKGAANQTASIFEVQDSAGSAIMTVNGTTTSAVAATRTFSGTEDLRTTLSSFAGISSGSVNRTSAIIGETRIGTTNNNLNYGISGTAGAYTGVGNAAAIQAYTFAIGGTTTSAYTYFAATPFTSSGFITNQYGLYIADQSYTGVTNAWGIYEAGANNNYFAGNVGIGDTSPSSLFTVGNGDLFTINTSGVITSSNNITPNSVKSAGQTDEYCLTYESTGTTWEWQSCSGGGGMAIGGSITSATQGSVLFAGAAGVLAQDNASLYFNDTTNRLGLGTTTPNEVLTVQGNINLSAANGGIYFDDTRYLYASSTNDSVVFGEGAGLYLLGGGLQNVGMGYLALKYTTTGDYNVAVGGYALSSNDTGTGNVAIGSTALVTAENSNNNIGIGYGAGDSIWRLAHNNIMIGYLAGENISDGSNNIIIGHDVDNINATASNRLNIGNIIFGTGIDGTGTTLSSGNIGIGSSTPMGKLSVLNTSSSATAGYLYGSAITVTDTGSVASGYDSTYGQKVLVTRTGSSVATVEATAVDGRVLGDLNTTNGYGGYFESKNAFKNTGIYAYAEDNSTTASNPGTRGLLAEVYDGGAITTGTDTNYAIRGILNTGGSNTGGTRSNYGSEIEVSAYSGVGGTVNNYGQYLFVQGGTTGATTNYGLYADVSGADNNYSGIFMGGNLGIGTTTPNRLLTLNSSADGQISINRSGTENLVIGADATGGFFQAKNSKPLSFFNTTTEIVRITNTGNVGIGTTTPNTKLSVMANSASTYAATFDNDGNNANRSGILIQAGLDDHTAAGPSTLIGFKDGDGTTVGSITFGSSVTAYNTTSDERLKTNIVDTNIGITQLMQVKVRDFNWKADADKSTLTSGFIAQELAQIYPQAVTIPKNLNDIWMVDYSKLMPLVIAGVQDQQVTVTEQGSALGTLGEKLLATIQSVGDLEAAVSTGLSENYHTEDETLTAGELVALATSSDATIRRATYNDEIFGVVSENAGIILGDGMSSAKPVALTGRVAVKVNDDGGDIKRGDAITVSSEDGVGTKATTTRRVIGTALEDMNGDSGTIHIYVSPKTYYAHNELGAIGSLFTAIDNNENDTLWGRITTLASNFVDGVLSVAGVKTEELCVGSVCVDEATFLKMVQDAGGSGQTSNGGGGSTPTPTPNPEPQPSPDPTPTPNPEPTPEIGPIAPEEPTPDPVPAPEAPVATAPEGGTL